MRRCSIVSVLEMGKETWEAARKEGFPPLCERGPLPEGVGGPVTPPKLSTEVGKRVGGSTEALCSLEPLEVCWGKVVVGLRKKVQPNLVF